MKRSKLLLSVWLFIPFLFVNYSIAQDFDIITPYNNAKKVVRNEYNFNQLRIKLPNNQYHYATGIYQEQYYVLDSIRGQKEKIWNHVVQDIEKKKGDIIFQDSTSLYFLIIKNHQRYFGRFYCKTHHKYNLKLVLEKQFESSLMPENQVEYVYDEFIEPVEKAPGLLPIKNFIVKYAFYSKYHFLQMRWHIDDKFYNKKANGRFWEYKFHLYDENGDTDMSFSSIEILENHYHYAISKKGRILRKMANMLIFSIDEKDRTYYYRVFTPRHGIYHVKVLEELDKDKSEAVLLE